MLSHSPGSHHNVRNPLQICFKLSKSHLSIVTFSVVGELTPLPSASYMCQWTGSASVQVMACRLFGAKPLPVPMVAYCQLDSWKYRNSIIFIEGNAFEIVVDQNGGHFVQGRWVDYGTLQAWWSFPTPNPPPPLIIPPLGNMHPQLLISFYEIKKNHIL